MEVKQNEQNIINDNNIISNNDNKNQNTLEEKKDINNIDNVDNDNLKKIIIENKEEKKEITIENKQEDKKEISNIELLEKINKLEEVIENEKKKHEDYVLSNIKGVDRDYLDFLVSKEKEGSIEEKIEKIKLNKPELFKEEENINIQNLNILNSKNKGNLKNNEIFRADFNKKSLTERMKLIKNGVKII